MIIPGLICSQYVCLSLLKYLVHHKNMLIADNFSQSTRPIAINTLFLTSMIWCTGLNFWTQINIWCQSSVIYTPGGSLLSYVSIFNSCDLCCCICFSLYFPKTLRSLEDFRHLEFNFMPISFVTGSIDVFYCLSQFQVLVRACSVPCSDL